LKGRVDEGGCVMGDAMVVSGMGEMRMRL
jgi:hypothetical protein